MFTGLGQRLRRLLHPPLTGVVRELHETKMLGGRILSQLSRDRGILDRLDDAEFKVFSQFGDDGIIQYLVHHVRLDAGCQTFIEFGVQSYQESNTRFLLQNNNWRGLVLDAGGDYIRAIVNDPHYWRHDLTAVHAFVDTVNVNELFTAYNFRGDIGLLSIDIDGNDWWIWDAITVVSPAILILEYNSVFGLDHAITIPYDPGFRRTRVHFSNLYFGASLKAHYLLSARKGYAFLGCNSAGNNAYFVRQDRLGKLRSVGLESGYRLSRFRESRGPDGRLTYLGGEARLKVIEDLPVVDVEKGRTCRIRDLTVPVRRAA